MNCGRDSPEARVATGFGRHYPDESNARNLQQRRQEILDDITDATGSVFLGLTYGCARCHNHKFDPILQADYYRLQAFFANTAADDHIPMLPREEARRTTGSARPSGRKRRATSAPRWRRCCDPSRQNTVQEYFDKYPPEIQAMILKPAARAQPLTKRRCGPRRSRILKWPMTMRPSSSRASRRQAYDALKTRAGEVQRSRPGRTSGGDRAGRSGPHGAGDARPRRRCVRRAEGGSATGIPDAARSRRRRRSCRPQGLESTGRRTALAKWLTDPENPLPARVMVNRIWHYHFGKGIAGTPSDFGVDGRAARRIPSCSTGWRRSSCAAAGA